MFHFIYTCKNEIVANLLQLITENVQSRIVFNRVSSCPREREARPFRRPFLSILGEKRRSLRRIINARVRRCRHRGFDPRSGGLRKA